MIDNDVSGSLVLESKKSKTYLSVYSPNTFIKKNTMSHVYQNVRIKKLHFVRTCDCACIGLCVYGYVLAWVCACMFVCAFCCRRVVVQITKIILMPKLL